MDREPARDALANGIGVATRLFREIAPEFERSDVSAQLLRLRLIAHHHGVLKLDQQAAQDEARRIQSFQALDDSRPQVRGGFYFGKRGGETLPYVNPVSTAFCMQALEFWDRHMSILDWHATFLERHAAGSWAFDVRFDLRQLI